MNSGQLPQPPSIGDLLDLLKGDIMSQLRVGGPGEVVSYDRTKGTASVLPCFNRVYNDGTVKPMPMLVDCPVFTQQGGGVHFGAPIASGDECLIMYADNNIDAWHSNGGQQTPLDARKHDLSDGFVLVGVNSAANPLVSALTSTEGGIASATAKVAINNVTGMVTISAGGKVLAIVLTTLLTALQTFLSAASADAGLQIAAPTTATAAGAAATAVGAAIAALGLILY